MSVIRILTEAVANKIGAGEVVERPSSVVKELLENALDAGAERLELAVEAGGKRLIRVVDDGSGMSHDDALLAFERHATSKIRSAEDLFAISTLGFRGEALPSIAAVSRLVLETRHASEKSGTRIEFAGGKLRDVKEVAWPAGTRVEVRELFFNTPARRKFLKSESTELGHIASLVTHYALAHPQKSFRLMSLTNEILNVSPVAASRERVYQVMGGQLLEQLVEIAPLERRMPIRPTWSDSGEEEANPEQAVIVKVSGFVSRPEVQKLNRNHIYFFVNRRLVRDRLILHAITEAYRNILPGNVFPVALVFLDLPPEEVDVNVHPSKIEVRFRHSGFMHDLVRDAIRQALIATRPVAAFPIPAVGESSGLPQEGRALSSNRRPSPRSAPLDEAAEIAEKIAEDSLLMKAPEGQPSYGSAPNISAAEFRLAPAQPKLQPGRLPLETTLSAYSPPVSATSETRPSSPGSIGVSEFPADLQPLGQVRESFIVATNAQGLWILDQHVVHERILFERHLRMRGEKKLEVQRLLLPIIIELTVEQQAAFQEIADELAANGFDIEPFGQRTIAVKTAPADVPHVEVERLVLEILDGAREATALSLDDLRAKIAASVSCHAAIKVNTPLDRAKMEWLLRELSKTECPMTCPHGRPIILRYSLSEIEKAFKRC